MKPPVVQPDLDRPASAPSSGDLVLTHLWHAVPAPDAFDLLRSRPDGLTVSEARKRLERYGPNELQETRRISPWQILLEQFKNVLIIILLIATVISFFLGHGLESVVIAVIVLFAVLLGFVQE